MIILLILLEGVGHGQEPISSVLREIEGFLKGGMESQQVVKFIEENGVDFEVTEEIKERLRKAGANAKVLKALEKAGAEFARPQQEERQDREVEEVTVREEEEKRAQKVAERQAKEEQQKVEAQKKKEEVRKARALVAAKEKEEAQKKADAAAQRQMLEAQQKIDATEKALKERIELDRIRREIEREWKALATAKEKEDAQKRVDEAARRQALEAQQKIEAAKQEKRRAAEEEQERVEAEKKIPKTKKGGDGTVMILIPAGDFWMGCNEKVDRECEANEKPGRTVYLDAFYIDQYEVDTAQYRRCVRAGGCTTDGLMTYPNCNWDKTGRGGHPINCVDWDQARTYCSWTGKRLPTEAEWEKAARGTDGRLYPWGNTWDANKTSAEKSSIGLYGKTDPVGLYESGVSPYGVHDMIGNVREWVADWYDEDYHKHAVYQNPQGPSSGKLKVLRGNSWDRRGGAASKSLATKIFYLGRNARTSFRNGYLPNERYHLVGFRCAQ